MDPITLAPTPTLSVAGEQLFAVVCYDPTAGAEPLFFGTKADCLWWIKAHGF